MRSKPAKNGSNEQRSLDPLDLQIIEQITAEPRISSRDLAERMKVAEATIRRRRARLDRENYIRYFALPNPRLMQYLDVLIWVKVEPQKVLRVATALAASSRTRSLDIIGGPYDILIGAYFRSTGDLLDFLTNCVASQDGVTATETFQSLRVLKRHFVFSE